MVVAVGLAMFAFVILDSIQQMDEVPPFLIVLMLGIASGFVGWAIGTQQEKRTQTKGASKNFALYGMLIGVAIGALSIFYKSETAAVETSEGNISYKELTEIREKRVLSNRFFVESLRAVRREIVIDLVRQRFPGLNPSDSLFDLFKNDAERTFQGIINQPRFIFHPDSEWDAVMSWLLNKEADKMGLEVSDDVVNEFIHSATGKHLDPNDFYKIRNEMNLSHARLYDILREQIRAEMVFGLKRPQRLMTPGDFGKRYRQLKVRQELEIAKIPVSEFLKFVPEPKEAELRIYFDLHKQPVSSITPAYIPSFYQPRKVKVSYLMATWEKVEKEVDDNKPVQEEDIKIHYLDKRDLLYLNPLANRAEPFPTFPKSKDTPTPNKESFDDKNDDAKPKPENENASLNDRSGDLRFVSFQESKQKKKSEAKSEKKPVKKQNSDNKSPKQPAKKKTAKKKTEQKPAIRVKQPPPPPMPESPPPTKYRPFDNLLKDEIRRELRDQRIETQMKERINTAKDWLRKNIEKPYRDMLLEPDEVKFDAQPTSDKAKEYAIAHDFEYTVTELLSKEEFTEAGNAGKFELSEDWERYAVPNAFNATSQGNSSVAILFDPIRDEDHKTEVNLYRISRSVVRVSRNRYLFWKVEDVLPRVPTLDDDGIRDKVVEAWKLSKARELSEEEKKDNVKRQTANRRAEELANDVRNSGLAMSEALLGKTVSGDADSALIEIPSNSNTFSWMRLTPNFDPGSRQQREPTLEDASVGGIKDPPGVGEEFLETVFEKLKDGEVGVAFNADKSVYYVVRVLNRTPASTEGEQELLNRFLREKLFWTQFFDPYPTPYDRMQEAEESILQRNWFTDFQRKYNIRFNTNPNASR